MEQTVAQLALEDAEALTERAQALLPLANPNPNPDPNPNPNPKP